MQRTENLQERKFEAEIAQIMAMTQKLNTETQKILKESQWHPFIGGAAFVGAVAAAVKIFF
jgi:hypothetical protein